MDAVDLLLTCQPSPSLPPLSNRRLLLDLDRNGGTDQLGMFPLFHKRTADVISDIFT